MPQERENPYPNVTPEEWAEIVKATSRETISARVLMARNIPGVPKRAFLTGGSDHSPILQGLVVITAAVYDLLDGLETEPSDIGHNPEIMARIAVVREIMEGPQAMSLRSNVRAILQQPFDGGRVWRAHGIGMLRTYLDEARLVRLNLWHSMLRTPDISTMHTHPWNLRSEVVTGVLTNVRWERVKPGDVGAQPWVEDRIPCGAVPDPEFALKGEAHTVFLRPFPGEVIQPGQFYTQKPDEIHTTQFLDGTATVMQRDVSDGVTEASVFWPLGDQWGDASRSVTADEVLRVCETSLALLDR